MTALVEAEGLVKRFVARRSIFGRPLSHVNAVDGVSFTVEAGKTLALVGESGSGKSTVGRLVLRLIEPTAGRMRFAGEDVFALSEAGTRAYRRQAQLVFQDPYASLNPRMTVGDILGEPLALHEIVPAAQRRQRVAQLMELVGLEPRFAPRYPHEFSGGQRQRIVIARALAVEPKLIVCDEPVSALDVSIRSQVLNLLRDLQQRLSLAYIFISHDLAVVKHIADHVAVMYLGRIVETAPTDELFANPRHPYTQALLSAIPIPRPRARRERTILQGDVPSPINPPPGCHLHLRCPHAIERCRIERPALIADGAHATACHRWPELPAVAATPPAAGRSAAFERLIGAFAARTDVRAKSGVDRVREGRLGGAPPCRLPRGDHHEDFSSGGCSRVSCSELRDGLCTVPPADRACRGPGRSRSVACPHVRRTHRVCVDLRQAVRCGREARCGPAARALARDLGGWKVRHHQAAAQCEIPRRRKIRRRSREVLARAAHDHDTAHSGSRTSRPSTRSRWSIR